MIIDCFVFFDELDLLEVRLNELKDIVDVFVLTESTHTFTNIEKPLYFEENKERFYGFNIINTIYEPDGEYYPTVFEKKQKQFNIDCAFDIFRNGDTIINGDADEIPRGSVLKKAIDDDWKYAGLELILFYYYMNCRDSRKRKKTPTRRLLRPDGWFKYNAKQNSKADKVYYDAGWHFSFLGDIKSKLEAWGHAPEYNKLPYNTKEHIEECKNDGKDLFMRKGRRKITFEFVDDLSYLPEYVLQNMQKFDKYIRKK